MRISDWSSDVCSSDLVRVIEWNPAGVYSDGCQHENSWTRDMHSFQFESLPTRVRFGSGIIAGLPAEAAHMGLSRLLLLSSPQQLELAERASSLLSAYAFPQFTPAPLPPPLALTYTSLPIFPTHPTSQLAFTSFLFT